MPTYVYTTDDGMTYEYKAPMNRIPQSLFVNGKIARRDIVAEHGGKRRVADPWVDHESLSLMVHPLDVPAYREDARKRGLKGVEIRDNGMFRFPGGMLAQRRYCAAYDYVNMQSYY